MENNTPSIRKYLPIRILLPAGIGFGSRVPVPTGSTSRHSTRTTSTFVPRSWFGPTTRHSNDLSTIYRLLLVVCLPNAPGPEIQVADTSFQYFSSCRPYKSSNLGTAVNDLDAPVLLDTGGNVGQVPTRVLHYRYNCDSAFQNCGNEEQFFLAAGYGQWQWKHYQNGVLVNSTLINDIEPGTASGTLPCTQSYQPYPVN